jgi:hypothetical protein
MDERMWRVVGKHPPCPQCTNLTTGRTESSDASSYRMHRHSQALGLRLDSFRVAKSDDNVTRLRRSPEVSAIQFFVIDIFAWTLKSNHPPRRLLVSL